jgi:hypothetical protein
MGEAERRAPQPLSSSGSGADAGPFEGGGWFGLMDALGLAGDAPAQVRRRLLAVVGVAWLPMLVLAGVEGRLLGDRVAMPFLLDVGAQVRLLIALPLLLLAKVEVRRRMPALLRQFTQRGLVPQAQRSRFDAALAQAQRQRDARLPELLLLVLALGIGIVAWRQHLMSDPQAWYATTGKEGAALSWAGLWYACVALPIVQFVMLRWYYRLGLWALLLWRISRLPLDLVAGHPDRAGGLGFLGGVGQVFAMLAFAHGALAAGMVGQRILFAQATLAQYADAIAVIVIMVQIVFFGPLLCFSHQLHEARREGLARYAALSDRLVRGFDAKWSGTAPPGEALVGSPDVSSTADMASTYELTQRMRAVPMTLQASVRLAVSTLLPIAPLLLTVMPLSQALKLLIGVR